MEELHASVFKMNIGFAVVMVTEWNEELLFISSHLINDDPSDNTTLAQENMAVFGRAATIHHSAVQQV